jgi:hypothetical protein
MKFSRRSEELELAGNPVTVQELSAAEFTEVMAIEDEHEQLLELLTASLTIKVTPDEIMGWPNSIVNQLTDAVLSINGLNASGN